jgi:hypothetical protein
VGYAAADANVAHGAGLRALVTKRATRWATTLYHYEEFWRETGHTPRENTRNVATLPDDERHQGEWARYQRRFAEKLCRYQTIRLDLSPTFKWDPHEHLRQTNFAACVRHVQALGRLPYLKGADKVEFALARWFGRQVRQLQTGTQPAGRAAQLVRLVALQSRPSRGNYSDA